MKKFIQILIGIVLIVLIFTWVDFDEVKSSLRTFKYEYLLYSFLVITADRILMAYKWKLLLKTKQIKLSLFEATKIYYIANFLGLFLPSTVGTDIVRTYYTSKKGASKTNIISVIIVERIIGFLCLFIFAITGLVVLINITSNLNFNSTKLLLALLTFTTIIIIAFLASLNSRVVNTIVNFLSSKKNKKFWSKFAPAIIELITSYNSHKEYKFVLLIFSVLTFLEIFLSVCWAYLIALGLNAHIDFIYFIAFLPLVILLGRMPVSFDGFGLKEGMFVYFLTRTGISSAMAFNIGFLNHLITIVGILPGGIFYLFNRDLKEIKSTGKQYVKYPVI